MPTPQARIEDGLDPISPQLPDHRVELQGLALHARGPIPVDQVVERRDALIEIGDRHDGGA